MSLDSVSDMPGSRRKTPLRTIQIDEELWRLFGEATEAAGTARADAFREFARWMTSDPDLWRDLQLIADHRGELVRRVVLDELRKYVNRHKHLLGPDNARATDDSR